MGFMRTSMYSLLLFWSAWHSGEGSRTLSCAGIRSKWGVEENRWLQPLSGNYFQHQTWTVLSEWLHSYWFLAQTKLLSETYLLMQWIYLNIIINLLDTFLFPMSITWNGIHQNCCAWQARTCGSVSVYNACFLHCSNSGRLLADWVHLGPTTSASSIWNDVQNCPDTVKWLVSFLNYLK